MWGSHIDHGWWWGVLVGVLPGGGRGFREVPISCLLSCQYSRQCGVDICRLIPSLMNLNMRRFVMLIWKDYSPLFPSHKHCKTIVFTAV